MSSLSYLGSKLAPICTVLAGSLTSIYTALASSGVLKTPNVKGMAGLSSAVGTKMLISLNSITATTTVAMSMLSYLQSSTHYVLASTVMTPEGSGILSWR
jgi:hypothetical protein